VPTEEAASLRVGIGAEPVGREPAVNPDMALASPVRSIVRMNCPPSGIIGARHQSPRANGTHRQVSGAMSTNGQTSRVHGTSHRASEVKIMVGNHRISIGNGKPAAMGAMKTVAKTRRLAKAYGARRQNPEAARPGHKTSTENGDAAAEPGYLGRSDPTFFVAPIFPTRFPTELLTTGWEMAGLDRW